MRICLVTPKRETLKSLFITLIVMEKYLIC